MKFSLQNVPIVKITGENLARSKRSDSYRTALRESVKRYGVLQPVLCCIDGEFFRLIAGFGRVDGAQAAGMAEVPAQVYQGKLPDIELLILAANENNVREASSFLDQADILERIVAEKKCTETEAGKLMGLKQSVTSKILSANARLAEDVKLELSKESIGYSIAYILSKAENHARQRELLRMMLANKWTRAQLEKAMKSEPTRALSFGKAVKVSINYPTTAGYDAVKEAIRELVNQITHWEKQGVSIDLLPKMVRS